jgi:transcription initiation factor TFIIIB Brf1 subunit/transcription initiation factor TFIIB
MKHSKAEIEEAQRLAKQAEAQVASQMEMIERMTRSGLSTDVAEEALRTMRKIVDQMHARLRSMTGWDKVD